jgi:hypothetical protein
MGVLLITGKVAQQDLFFIAEARHRGRGTINTAGINAQKEPVQSA